MGFIQNFNKVNKVNNVPTTTSPESASSSARFRQTYSNVDNISGNPPDGFKQIFGNNPNGSELQNNDKEGVNVEEKY